MYILHFATQFKQTLFKIGEYGLNVSYLFRYILEVNTAANERNRLIKRKKGRVPLIN